MFRAILYLMITVIVISVIRTVLGIIGKVFAAMMTPQNGPGAAGPTAKAPPATESLHKDPVCGTFVAPSTAWQMAANGKTYYFCSTACRDKFKG